MTLTRHVDQILEKFHVCCIIRLSRSNGLIFDSCPGCLLTHAGVAGLPFAEGVSSFRKSGLLVNVKTGRKLSWNEVPGGVYVVYSRK